jgi:hypothetical protein
VRKDCTTGEGFGHNTRLFFMLKRFFNSSLTETTRPSPLVPYDTAVVHLHLADLPNSYSFLPCSAM